MTKTRKNPSPQIIEPNEALIEVLKMVINQNEKILEQNAQIVRSITSPVIANKYSDSVRRPLSAHFDSNFLNPEL